MWFAIQCNRFECSKFLVTKAGTKRKKCPYCNKSFNVNDNFRGRFESQDDARNYIQKMNLRSP
jgi:hypothetical protein